MDDEQERLARMGARYQASHEAFLASVAAQTKSMRAMRAELDRMRADRDQLALRIVRATATLAGGPS